MQSLTLGFAEWGAAIEVRLLDTEEFQQACTEHKQAADTECFSRLLRSPKRHEADAQIFAHNEKWTWEIAAHEMMHCALHLAKLHKLTLDPVAEVLPRIAGDFARYLSGPFEPKGNTHEHANV